MQNAVNECLKFLAAQFLTDRSSSDAVPDLAHHTHGRRRKAASRILERRKRDRGGGAEQDVVVAVVVRSKSELQTPATDVAAAVVSATCISLPLWWWWWWAGGRKVEEGGDWIRKVQRRALTSPRETALLPHSPHTPTSVPPRPLHSHHHVFYRFGVHLIQRFDVSPILNSFQRLLPSWQGTTWSRRSWSRLAGSCSPPAT